MANKNVKLVLRIIRKRKFLLLGFYLFLNLFNATRQVFKQTALKTGNRKENSSDLVNYYKFCINTLTKSELDFAKVGHALEVGPGDSAGLAVVLKNFGVQNIDIIDKFQKYDIITPNQSLYMKLTSEINGLELENVDTSAIKQLDLKQDLLQRANDPAHLKYDLIYSVSVCEHLWPLSAYLKAMNMLLNENGSMLHIINFTDHGMFSPEHNRFYFRKINSWIYDLVMKPGGRPNRVLPSEILTQLSELGLETKIIPLRTHTKVLNDGDSLSYSSIPNDEINEIKEVYGSEIFDSLDNVQDIAVGSALLVGKKVKC